MAKIQRFCISEIQSKLHYTSKEVLIKEIQWQSKETQPLIF